MDLVDKNRIYFVKDKKWDLVKRWFIFIIQTYCAWITYLWNAILKKKKNFNLTINSFFENSKSTILFKKKTFLEKF